MSRKTFKIMFIMFLILAIGTIISYAGISTNDPTVNSEDTITITVKSSETLGSYKVSIAENSGLTFQSVSAPNGVTADVNGSTVTGITMSGTTVLATYTFKAPKVEQDTKYTVKFSATETSDINTNPISGSSAPSTITVKTNKKQETPQTTQEQPTQEQPTQTPTGKLTSITVNGKTYTDPKQDITVTVENEVENTTISAVSSDGSAVSGTGNVALKVGTTVTKLTVNGTTYTVRIRRLAEVDDTPNIIDETETEPEEEEPKEALALSALEIKDFTLTPEFSRDVYTYTLDIDTEDKDVEKLEINAVANQENAKVEITGNENLQEGENIINITLTSEDEKETVTYQITVNKIITSTEVVGKTSMDDTNQELENTTNMSRTTRIVIATIAIVGLIAGIIFAVIEYIYTNKKDEEHEYNEPFYIKEDEEGRLDVVDKTEDMEQDVEADDSACPAEEEQTENSETIGYIEELYKNNFSEDELEQDIERTKKKKAKGKHFD